MTVKVKEFFKIPDDVDSFRLGTGSPYWSPSYCSSSWFDKASKKPLCPSARLLSLNQFEWLWACCTAEHNRPCFAGTMLGFAFELTIGQWPMLGLFVIQNLCRHHPGVVLSWPLVSWGYYTMLGFAFELTIGQWPMLGLFTIQKLCWHHVGQTWLGSVFLSESLSWPVLGVFVILISFKIFAATILIKFAFEMHTLDLSWLNPYIVKLSVNIFNGVKNTLYQTPC